jgi:hypothetical protein
MGTGMWTFVRAVLSVIIGCIIGCRIAHAQYQPIPNYTGIGAGQKFRNDVNNHLSGVTPIAPRIVSLPFAQLPSEQDGQEYWCLDCMRSNPCAGGGAGALAVGQRGVWSCTSSGSVNGIFNVVEYGANYLGTADASAGAQAAINAACAAALSPANAGLSSVPTVYFPPGVYWFSQPVLNSCGKTILIAGAGMYSSSITAKISGVGAMTGPLFVTMPSNYVSSLGQIFDTSLATGSGNSLYWSGSSQGTQRFYLDIGDAIINDEGGALTSPAPLNGLTQFDIRGFVKLPSAAPTAADYIWSSSNGAMDGQTGCSNASGFTACAGAYGIGAGNNVITGPNWDGIAYLKVGGIEYVLTGNQHNFTPGSILEEELSYDGSNIRLIVNGKLVAVQAATGTVTQRPDENMVLGGVNQNNLWSTPAQANTWLGWLDSVQLSNTARSTCAGSTTLGASCYTAATAKFAGDSNTIFLTNFDQTLNPSGVLNSATQSGALIAADYTNGSGSGLAWMPLRNYLLGIGQEQDFRDFGMSSQSFGIFDAIGTLSTFANIYSNTNAAGIYLSGGAFGTHIENWIGTANGYNIAPFVEVQAGGLTDLENVHLTCGNYCVIGQDYLYLNHVFLQIPNQTIYGLVLQGGAVVTDLEPDSENCGSAISALVVGSTETRFIGGSLQSCSGQPLMTVSPVSLRQLVLDGTTGSVAGSPSSFINILPAWANGSGLLQPIRWIAPNINGLPVGSATATIPLSNQPNQVIAELGVTKIINVRDYGAKCDNAADDTTAIQTAFSAAAAGGQPVYFPPGTCYVAGPITYKGQSFYGAGEKLSTIRGAPGKDVFVTIDPVAGDNGSGQAGWQASVHDIQLQVDSTSDVSASNTNRILGRHFYDAAMTSGSAVLTSAQAEFTAGDVGHSIQVNGAGASGANLVTTISSLVNPGYNGTTAQANLAVNASATVSSATGYLATDSGGVTTTVGNCAFAFLDSDANTAHFVNSNNRGLLHASFNRVFIASYGQSETNHVCAFYDQIGAYDTSFEDVTINQTYYGILHLLPTLNQTAGAYTPDDNAYRRVSITSHIPFISYDGEQDLVDNLQLYGSNAGDLGFFLLHANVLGRTDPTNWTINSLFVEPNSSTNATVDWVTGTGHSFVNGNLASGGTNVVQWDANSSQALNETAPNDGTHQTLKLAGSRNQFLLAISQPANFASDTGFANSVLANAFTGSGFYSSRPVALDSPRLPSAMLGGDFAQSGSAYKSYVSGTDLFITPGDIQWSALNPQPTITLDSTVAPSGQYTVLPQASLPAYFQKVNGQTWQAGTNVPLSKVRVYIMEKASVNCTEGIYFTDSANVVNYGQLGSANLTANWQVLSFDADVSGAMANGAGALRLNFNGTSPNTATVYIAWIAIRPWTEGVTAHGINDAGQITTALLATPAAPAVTVNGTGGTTSYSYFCVGHDAAGGVTAASSAGTTSIGNATLSSSNFNTVTCGPQAGIVTWDVLKTNTSTALAAGVSGNGLAAVLDIGQTTSAYTAPARNSTGDIVMASGSVLSNGCKGTVALTPGSPSTATVSNSCVTTSCAPICTDETNANAIKCVPSAGALALTGPNTVTDTVSWACN